MPGMRTPDADAAQTKVIALKPAVVDHMCIHAEYTPSITKGMPEALPDNKGEILSDIG
jgi:hypothetical protein